MSAQPNLTEHEYELLSAYLDGVLDDDERAALESRLQTDAALRQELNALRQTVKLVQDLPTLKAPRSFILTPAMLDGAQVTAAPVHRPRIVPFPVLSLMSAAASIVMIALGLLLFFDSQTLPSAAPEMPLLLDALTAQVPEEIALMPTKTPAPDADTLRMMPPEQPEAAAAGMAELFAEAVPDLEEVEESMGTLAMTAPGADMEEDDFVTMQMAPEDETGLWESSEAGDDEIVPPAVMMQPQPTPTLMLTPDMTAVAHMQEQRDGAEEQEAAVEAPAPFPQAALPEAAILVTEETPAERSPWGLLLIISGGTLLLFTGIGYWEARKRRHG